MNLIGTAFGLMSILSIPVYSQTAQPQPDSARFPPAAPAQPSEWLQQVTSGEVDRPRTPADARTARFTVVDSDQEEMENIIFARRRMLPDSPTPKAVPPSEEEACPGGAGHPCALLGGFRHYSDMWKTDYHERTWLDAFKTPGMLFAVSSLVGSTILDIEGSQACINAGTCREVNPLMGQHPKSRKYAVALPIAGLMIWQGVALKKHGHGTSAMLLMWATTCTHFYFGVSGFAAGKTH